MEKSTVKITKLTAAEGMTLTNGEAYGKIIYLSCNDKAANWQEITDEEAAELQKVEDPENI